MLDISARYNAKLLLFGEYTTLVGGKSLAIPNLKYHGSWSYQSKINPFAIELSQLSNHIGLEKSISFDKIKFDSDLQAGLYFDSDIPQGCGCGSSGALVAAIYTDYCIPKTEFYDVKKELAYIEQFYHGTSSGTDPLVIYLNAPIVISQRNIKVYPNLSPPQIEFIDSKIPRKTDGFVDHFIEKYHNNSFYKKNIDNLKTTNDNAIDAFIEGDTNTLEDLCHSISHLQFEIMEDLIVENIRPIWAASLKDKSICIKLNGAGGGGFYQKIIF